MAMPNLFHGPSARPCKADKSGRAVEGQHGLSLNACQNGKAKHSSFKNFVRPQPSMACEDLASIWC